MVLTKEDLIRFVTNIDKNRSYKNYPVIQGVRKAIHDTPDIFFNIVDTVWGMIKPKHGRIDAINVNAARIQGSFSTLLTHKDLKKDEILEKEQKDYPAIDIFQQEYINAALGKALLVAENSWGSSLSPFLALNEKNTPEVDFLDIVREIMPGRVSLPSFSRFIISHISGLRNVDDLWTLFITEKDELDRKILPYKNVKISFSLEVVKKIPKKTSNYMDAGRIIYGSALSRQTEPGILDLPSVAAASYASSQYVCYRAASRSSNSDVPEKFYVDFALLFLKAFSTRTTTGFDESNLRERIRSGYDIWRSNNNIIPAKAKGIIDVLDPRAVSYDLINFSEAIDEKIEAAIEGKAREKAKIKVRRG